METGNRVGNMEGEKKEKKRSRPHKQRYVPRETHATSGHRSAPNTSLGYVCKRGDPAATPSSVATLCATSSAWDSARWPLRTAGLAMMVP